VGLPAGTLTRLRAVGHPRCDHDSATGLPAEVVEERPVPTLVVIVILAVGYFLTGKVSSTLPSDRWIVLPVWPPVGVAIVGLLVFGRRGLPGIAVGSFLTGLAQGFPADLGTTAAQTLGPLAVVAMLESRSFQTSLAGVSDVLHLVVFGAVGMIPGAAVCTAVHAAAGNIGDGEWLRFGLVWWVGDVMGILLVVPLLLGLVHWKDLARRRREAAVMLVAAAIATRLLFSGSLPLMFLVFPFALWAALRLGPLVVGTLNAVVAGIAIWTTAGGYGPFAGLPRTTRLFVLEAFNAGIAVTSLVLAAAVTTMNRLTDENDRLHAEVRSQLHEVLASRARIVQAAYRERRRVERNLHDGAQQRLVSLAYTLGLALSRSAPGDDPELHAGLVRAGDEVRRTLSDLRSLAQGIHPALLTQEGLGAALESLAEQATLPVDVHAPCGRYPPVVEAAAYFVVSEALANVSKHAHANAARVCVTEAGDRLVVEVSDDGIGGADPSRGSGLTGLVDRVSALDGRVCVDSPLGCGTRVRAVLPCGWS
jgi:signal transduction histidine kinase